MANSLALLSAFFFIVANSIRIVHMVNLRRAPGGPGATPDLETLVLMEEWDYRRREAPLFQSGNAINAIAWFFLAIPMLQLTWGLSRGGVRKTGIHTAMAIFIVGGCCTELVARLMLVGMTSTSIWISRDFNLMNWLPESYNVQDDGIGWKALEISYLITRGLILWVDAFEWICLFFICMLTYFSIGTQSQEKRVLSMHFARLGLAIGFFSFIDFSADILRLMDQRDFMFVAVIIGVFNTIILLPIWITYLAFNLHKVMPTYDPRQDDYFGATVTTSI